MMLVSIWLIVTVVAIACLLLLGTILMFFAWKGMELLNRELQARLAIVQVDVSGFFRDVRAPITPRAGRARLEDDGASQ